MTVEQLVTALLTFLGLGVMIAAREERHLWAGALLLVYAAVSLALMSPAP